MRDGRALRAHHTALVDHSSRNLADLLRKAILERFELQDDEEIYARISRLLRRISGVDQ